MQAVAGFLIPLTIGGGSTAFPRMRVVPEGMRE
jgi:hypothetical protein